MKSKGSTMMNPTARARFVGTLIAALASMGLGAGQWAAAQTPCGIPQSITTPNRVETRIGPLDFNDGAPSAETVQKVRDTLDFTHGLDAFLNSYGGASAYAIRQGFISIGATDNSVVIF